MTTIMRCGMCSLHGSDVEIVGCGCTMHAKCVPVNLVATTTPLGFDPVQSRSLLCPACNTCPVQSVRLFPLSLNELDNAIEIRKHSKKNSKNDPEFSIIETETVYMHLTRARNEGSVSSSLSDNDHQRTGRWTNEEIAYVDFLVDCFNRGLIPMAQGVRLNDFLGEMLMCKGSRLTKKMKNARLSSRSYQLNTVGGRVDGPTLSTLEEKFFQSISNEATRIELRFNVSKAWRSHFSNFCVQIGSELLDANDWITSLETIERRSAQAEETIRKARRRRMGLALKTDVKAAPDGVFFAGMPAQRNSKIPGMGPVASAVSLTSADRERGDSVSVASGAASDEGSQSDFISHVLDIGGAPGQSNDFSSIFNDLLESPAGRENSPSSFLNNSNSGPFMEEIISYMETNDLPFQHADVWVPSKSEDEMRLVHAGHATRRDVDPALFWQLSEWGEYSTNFSFVAGVGLPGRVFSTNEASWECRIDLADPAVFERSGGAKVYGIKTGFGLPIDTQGIGRVIVVLYSILDSPMDRTNAEKWVSDLKAYSPEPKWKLVVDMKEEVSKERVNRMPVPPLPSTQRAAVDHFQHSHKIGDSSPVLSALNDMKPPHSVTPKVEHYDVQEEEQNIAKLLGEHMPLAPLPPLPGVDSQGGASGPYTLLPHFMSLRLLLLRAPNRRTKEESERLDVIVRSYRGYCQDKQRSDKDLAALIVQDWAYLNPKNSPNEVQKPPPKMPGLPVDSHQCHVMDAPASGTYNENGVPAPRPPSLQYTTPPPPRLHSLDGNDFDNVSPMPVKKRRISSVSESGFQGGS